MTGVLIAEMLLQLLLRALRRIAAAQPMDRAIGAAGLVLGVVVGSAVCVPFAIAGIGAESSFFRPLLIIGILGMAGIIGMLFTLSLREELWRLFGFEREQASVADPETREETEATVADSQAPPKVLDTSVIIDGRIAAVRDTGFLEGKLIIPSFVLGELQHIADSADPQRRKRGRRGLVMLNKMQKEFAQDVQIVEEFDLELSDTDEVDIRLVHVSKHLGGHVVTNDFNLSKVAELHGVQVLNVNELANALKPVLLHGEELQVNVVKVGREPGQGVGYLEDGTMVVVEGAADRVGDDVLASVTSMIQTVAGKMVFASLAEGE
ncbi:MAG: TRAM domain-containing protein [Armatimonadia bacterium]|nr:TRAM domain-containing protein [Armatimonadia bacterium]